MCLALWILNWSKLSYNLQLLAAGIGLAAGIRIIFVSIGHIIGRKIDAKDGSVVSRELWIQSKYLSVMSRMPRVRRFAKKRIPIIGALLLGYCFAQAQFYMELHHSVESYRIEVLRKYDNYRYLVRELDPNTNVPVASPAGQPHAWFICYGEVSIPNFEPGMVADVSVADLGCKSFLNRDHNGAGWNVVRRAETGKFIAAKELQ